MDEVICASCGRKVRYFVRETDATGTIRGRAYAYTGKQAFCSECGAPVDANEVVLANQEALMGAYRKANNIVSLETVRALPDKYAIGKRPLSLLLGWGEQTFSRYCDGDLPTRQYSDVLIRIDQDPAYYLELLEAGRDNLRSPASYAKSKKKVEALLEEQPEEETSKIYTTVRYLLHQCEDITPLALQKGLYYTQGFYYAFYGRFLFEEDCEAGPYGPVYREVYSRYRDYRFDAEEGIMPFYAEACSVQEKALFDSIVMHVCCYSGWVLEHFTHNEMPWLSARENQMESCVIPKESIGTYFMAVKKKYNMVNPNDIRNYTQDMMQAL